jgi:hypothetical protein
MQQIPTVYPPCGKALFAAPKLVYHQKLGLQFLYRLLDMASKNEEVSAIQSQHGGHNLQHI